MTTSYGEPALSGKGGASTWGTLSGVAGAIAAVLTVVFLVFPAMKPQPPPTQLGGQITNIQFSGSDPSTSVALFTVNVKLDGFNGKACLLTVSVQNETSWIYQDAQLGTYTPQANEDSAGAQWRVQVPQTAGNYRATFTLRDPNGTQLDQKQSDILTVN